MKTPSLLFALLLPSAAILAEEPPKLVPRPVPGLPLPAEGAPASLLAPAVAAVPQAPVLMTNPDRARVLYIHRRASLPAELTKDLPVSNAMSASPATMLNERQGAVKIIPKAQVAQILTPKS